MLPHKETPNPQPLRQRTRRKILRVTAVICFVLLFIGLWQTTACRRAVQSDDKPHYGGQIIVPLYGTVLSNSALDPAEPCFDPIAGMIYEGLTHWSAASGDGVEPALAESWSVSDDNLTWRFKIRSDARFHDDESFAGAVGRKVSAADVIYSWERLFKSQKFPAGFNSFGRFIEGAREVREGAKEHASGLRAVDDGTLEVRLVTPFVGFLQSTTWLPTSVVPREAVERYGGHFAEHPVGTGAFRFVEWDVDEHVILARHPNYWKRDADGNRLPYLDSVKYQIFASPLTTFQSLVNGVSDMAPLPPDLANEVLENSQAKDGDLRLRAQYAARHLYAYRMTTPPIASYLSFQMERATPFARDARLRRAVALAMQRAGSDDARQPVLLKSLLGELMANNGQGFVHDLAEAESLLQEAGYPRGRGLPKLRLLTFPGVFDAYRARIKNLGALGIEVEERPITLSEKERALRDGDFDLFMETWDFYYHDISSQLTHFLSDAPPEENPARYRNPQLDALIKQADATASLSERRDLIGQVEDLLEREAPYITFDESSPQPRRLVLLRGDVRIDARSRAQSALDLRKVWLAPKTASTDATR